MLKERSNRDPVKSLFSQEKIPTSTSVPLHTLDTAIVRQTHRATGWVNDTNEMFHATARSYVSVTPLHLDLAMPPSCIFLGCSLCHCVGIE